MPRWLGLSSHGPIQPNASPSKPYTDASCRAAWLSIERVDRSGGVRSCRPFRLRAAMKRVAPFPRRPFSTGNAPPSPASKNRKRLLPTESLHAVFVSALLAQVLRSPSSDLRQFPANEAPSSRGLERDSERRAATGISGFAALTQRPTCFHVMACADPLDSPRLAGCSPELKSHMPPTDFCNRMRPASTPNESS